MANVSGLDACFVGVPIDWGTSNRSGTRFGPRQIRSESVLVRACNTDTGAQPYNSINVADCGDVIVTPYDLVKTCKEIEEQYKDILSHDCIPLTLGGDHTITYPILKAIKVCKLQFSKIYTEFYSIIFWFRYLFAGETRFSWACSC